LAAETELENEEEKGVTEKGWRVFETVIMVAAYAIIVMVFGVVMYLAFGWQFGRV
jgi:hypothetical protein